MTPSAAVVELLSSLDAEQAAAVYATDRLIRARAGAGSGKTRALVARVAWLVQDQGVPAASILVVTFSKKAADELQHRLRLLGIDDVKVSTLHSVGYLIMRQEVRYLKPVDGVMQKRVLRKVIADLKWKGDFSEALRAINTSKAFDTEVDVEMRVVYDGYQRELGDNHQCDFGDMILIPVQVLREKPLSVSFWSKKWSHILVDEAQDTSRLQWELIEFLVDRATTNLFVAGDAQQSIYGFRGARPDLMVQGIDQRFGSFRDYPISTNYRSDPAIVNIANTVMRGDPWRLQMRAFQQGVASGAVSFVGPCGTPREEAVAVVERIQQLHAAGTAYSEMAVLYRTNAQSEPFETACVQANIPAVVIGDVGFYARSEVLDCLAYLRLSVQDCGEAFSRVYNRPSRYLGAAWKRELDLQGGWPTFVERFGDLTFSKRYMRDKARDFFDAVGTLRSMARDGAPPWMLLNYVIEGLGYRKWLLGEEPDDMDNMRSENLDQLLKAAKPWVTVAEFLEFTDRATSKRREDQEAFDAVQLMTVHRAKGLEWPVVFMSGVTQHSLPHIRGNKREERRVLYVGLTRARTSLFISGTMPRSVFWDELSPPTALDELFVNEDPAHALNSDAPAVDYEYADQREAEDDMECERAAADVPTPQGVPDRARSGDAGGPGASGDDDPLAPVGRGGGVRGGA